jgi:hypothetical protein
LEKAERNLKKCNYVDVGIICGSIFENILKDLFLQIKTKSDEKFLNHIESVELKLNKQNKTKTEKFTIGNMLALFKDIRRQELKKEIEPFNFAKKLLKKNLKILNSINLQWLRLIRNRCIHKDAGCPATPLEVKYLYYSVMLILEELGYYSDSEKKKCSECGTILSNDWNYCPCCSTRIKLICPECGYEVEQDYKSCPKCYELLYIISEQEAEILSDTKVYLSKIHSESTICSICWKRAEFCGGELDEDTGMELHDYELSCVCENEIDEILKSRCIRKDLKFKYGSITHKKALS